MKKLLLGIVLLVSTINYGQVSVITTDRNEDLLYMNINSQFKSVSLDREGVNNVRLSFEFKSDNSIKSAVYIVYEAFTTTLEDKKCTRMNIKNNLGIKFSIIVTHEDKEIYVIEDGIKHHYRGLGVKYE